MKHHNFSIRLIALMVIGVALAAGAGTFEGMSTAGILATDGATFLRGNPSYGDLVQLIWPGPDGEVDPPDGLGGTSDDDSLLGSTYIGYGYPFNPNEGKFCKTWTHDLLSAGNYVYLRAWDDSVVIVNKRIYYGDSELHLLASDFDSHDFRSFTLSQALYIPVEITLFEASAYPGVITLEWVTQSESNNLGFDLFRSTDLHGEKQKINEKMIDGAGNSQIRHEYSFDDRDIQAGTRYYYWLSDIAFDGTVTYHGPKSTIALVKPDEFLLAQNYPNPFNPSTSISYTLKESGEVRLSIYNIRGQLIRSLVHQQQMAGQYNQEWDGRDDSGSIVPTGTYIYTLEINGFKAVRRMTMAK